MIPGILRSKRPLMVVLKGYFEELATTKAGRRARNWLIFMLASVPFGLTSYQRLPAGHVGVVQTIFGDCRPSLHDESGIFFITPIYEKCYPLRVWPIKKRLVQEFVTSDNKIVEAVIHLRLRAKVYWAQDIVMRMGVDFARYFIEKEVSLDTESIVAKHTFDELVSDNEQTTEIINELIGKTQEAACFCRLDLLDMTVLFRDPLDAP